MQTQSILWKFLSTSSAQPCSEPWWWCAEFGASAREWEGVQHSWLKFSILERVNYNDHFVPTAATKFHAWLEKYTHCTGCMVRFIELKSPSKGNCTEFFSLHHSTSMKNFHSLCRTPSHADVLSPFKTEIFCWPFWSWLDNFFDLLINFSADFDIFC